jgi:hypothetical protein
MIDPKHAGVPMMPSRKQKAATFSASSSFVVRHSDTTILRASIRPLSPLFFQLRQGDRGMCFDCSSQLHQRGFRETWRSNVEPYDLNPSHGSCGMDARCRMRCVSVCGFVILATLSCKIGTRMEDSTVLLAVLHCTCTNKLGAGSIQGSGRFHWEKNMAEIC